ncbi:hypothetical protein V1L54_26965 [Streptomyces sp. TRM 70361]|uniref:hypothetical protein n=1 Tax=Streptomyces sp. TRM 70361 TaxID=3116553 RepID=UPI002E7AC209|nr:hypothetical protein [Streptomyces sp. TRM 70361]MEE1943006.1 hypothetical protein [Streptomyces sp. TRM 70361]
MGQLLGDGARVGVENGEDGVANVEGAPVGPVVLTVASASGAAASGDFAAAVARSSHTVDGDADVVRGPDILAARRAWAAVESPSHLRT